MFHARLLAGLVASIMTVGTYAAPTGDPVPDWAFIVPDPSREQLPEGRITVPGSALSITPQELNGLIAALDWHPQDHPAMPDVVGRGQRAPKQLACSLCHLPTGVGAPDTAALAGLPVEYIEQQVVEFRTRRRGCVGPDKSPCTDEMVKSAEQVSDAQVKEAAEYYSRLTYRSRTRVVEAAMVPKTEVVGYDLAAIKGVGKEPIGDRILELPDDPTLFYLGDWRTPITAYVPPGSIARGKALVENGVGAQPCTLCHGKDLKGVGVIPPLAGRSPSYIVRQLYDIQYGYRKGPSVVLMQPQVAHLNARDRIAIAAYLASLSQ